MLGVCVAFWCSIPCDLLLFHHFLFSSVFGWDTQCFSVISVFSLLLEGCSLTHFWTDAHSFSLSSVLAFSTLLILASLSHSHSLSVQVGFLRSLHRYEIVFTLPEVPVLGKDVCSLPSSSSPTPRPLLKVNRVTPTPEGTWETRPVFIRACQRKR